MYDQILMQLEQQVSSLELSKRLKELGVRQESAFYWLVINEPPQSAEVVFAKPNPFELFGSHLISAFTVAELGEMLPHETLSGRAFEGEWKCYQRNPSGERPFIDADTEANARAKMLVYLIEHGIIKP